MTKASIEELKTMMEAEREVGDSPTIVSWVRVNSGEPYWELGFRLN